MNIHVHTPKLLERDIVVGCHIPAPFRQLDVYKDFARALFETIETHEHEHARQLTNKHIYNIATRVVCEHAATGGRFIRFTEEGRMEVVEAKDATVYIRRTMDTACHIAAAAGNGTKVSTALLQCLGMQPWKKHKSSHPDADVSNKRKSTHDQPHANYPNIDDRGRVIPGQHSTIWQQESLKQQGGMVESDAQPHRTHEQRMIRQEQRTRQPQHQIHPCLHETVKQQLQVQQFKQNQLLQLHLQMLIRDQQELQSEFQHHKSALQES